MRGKVGRTMVLESVVKNNFENDFIQMERFLRLKFVV